MAHIIALLHVAALPPEKRPRKRSRILTSQDCYVRHVVLDECHTVQAALLRPRASEVSPLLVVGWLSRDAVGLVQAGFALRLGAFSDAHAELLGLQSRTRTKIRPQSSGSCAFPQTCVPISCPLH